MTTLNDLNDGRSRMHEPTGRWRLGLALAVAATVLWSTVPIALSLLLDRMDAITITWYRFAAGAIVLGVFLAARGQLPPWPKLLAGKRLWLVTVAGVGLSGNFVLYLHALHYIPPGASQIVMQLAPLFMMLGGVLVFREPFRRGQWSGLAMLLVGLMLFFHRRLADLTGNLSDYSLGALLVAAAALIWAAYALVQKQLLRVASSTGIMLVLYAIGVALMLPFTRLGLIRDLNGGQYIVMVYSIANVLVGYGCFAEALRHWEATRVSAVICATPLLTLAMSHPAHVIWPDRIMPDETSAIGLVGALLVVAGSMLTALAGARKGARRRGDSEKGITREQRSC